MEGIQQQFKNMGLLDLPPTICITLTFLLPQLTSICTLHLLKKPCTHVTGSVASIKVIHGAAAVQPPWKAFLSINSSSYILYIKMSLPTFQILHPSSSLACNLLHQAQPQSPKASAWLLVYKYSQDFAFVPAHLSSSSNMELTRMLALLLVIVLFSSCSLVHGRTYNITKLSIAEPPMADPPTSIALLPSPAPVAPLLNLNSTNSTTSHHSFPPPEPINAGYGNSTNSTATLPLPLPPTDHFSGNSTNSSSRNPPPISPLPPPSPVAPALNLNSTNSTTSHSSPPLEPINPGYGNSTATLPLPLPPADHFSGNSTNSSSTNPPPISPLPPSPSPVAPVSNLNSTNSTTSHSSPPPEPINPGYENSTATLPLPPTDHFSGNSTNSSITNPPTISPLPSPAPAPAAAEAGSDGNSTSSAALYDVRAFGAVGDGISDDTEAFKAAWDAACQEGPGVIVVPRGYSFKIRSILFLGPCQSELTLQVDGTIAPPDGPDEWPQNTNRKQWLVFYRANGLTLQGSGLIDGKGEKWWNLTCKPHQVYICENISLQALRFFSSSNLAVRGIRVQNSPQFHFRFDNCRNITVDSISISSPALSPNTDGIHVENTDTVRIYNSVIANGDDCVSIGTGSFNVDIRNVTCGPSHGISIGSLGKANSRACVANITVKDSVIRHSDNGARIKTWQGGLGSVSAVRFENIRMDTVRNPIIIDQYYCDPKPCKNHTNAVYVSDISYSNIRGTYDTRSPPMHFGCSSTVPCTNITLSGVELFPAKGVFISDPFCWNVYGATAALTIPPVSCLVEGFPTSIMQADSDKCY
ncbi:hypothetical protein Cni_G04774 [Canna indica]|uniref:Polygalacturonase n=1 Tax=Canna indica TaxID=4628 RepID=A0AAQ3Q4T3_9LILI|nr:hypothetical protein Cni_G04774 [Canna indica]